MKRWMMVVSFCVKVIFRSPFLFGNYIVALPTLDIHFRILKIKFEITIDFFIFMCYNNKVVSIIGHGISKMYSVYQ